LPKVCLGTDHAGFRLKEEIAAFLRKKGYKIEDFGTYTEDSPDDYPDFIIPTAEAVAKSRGKAVGIIFGGSGLGECLAANKVPGIRAVAAYDRYTVKMSKLHNNANVLSLGSRTITGKSQVAKRLVKLWLETKFSGDFRHQRRLKKISDYEKRT
ncbi:MAG: RpiB/LacA/LacB family sugar-phosphate isomerase, partial [candidate division Zixibacteria bacterium]|nr:RpiB/LacA/LacB family sugar-phosphate isomerase [candidate division Zixibacteria bacterium]